MNTLTLSDYLNQHQLKEEQYKTSACNELINKILYYNKYIEFDKLGHIIYNELIFSYNGQYVTRSDIEKYHQIQYTGNIIFFLQLDKTYYLTFDNFFQNMCFFRIIQFLNKFHPDHIHIKKFVNISLTLEDFNKPKQDILQYIYKVLNKTYKYIYYTRKDLIYQKLNDLYKFSEPFLFLGEL